MCFRLTLVVVVLPDPFRGMGAWRNSTEIQQSGHATRSDQRSKMEEVVPKMARRRGSDGGQSKSDPAECVRRRCMKNSPYFLSCIGKSTKEGCDRGSEVETVHSG